ncbi:LacI family transcriptional regulator [Micromonospora sp. R77]|uniref:LacI family DNA-binding transcriptional regulator n=1 Tax=Micromonospora sp. R77 TaxID=2925836 RepID=UPI001F625609|nr:LacI family DNA-binding transcriptional regulator [Micromonospora sp. R77]MCI4066243.1 LacI family transcriptional regulator [Micromonospora sp. R77]
MAKEAGVSRATVSRVMNGLPTVDPELAERVRVAAAALGYEPDGTAQSLALGRTGVVGIIVPDLGNPVFQAVLRGLSSAAGERDYRVLIADSHEQAEEEPILAREIRRRSDGLVLCAPRMPDEVLRQVAAARTPVVLLNRRLDGLDVPTVSVDHAHGMRAIAAHLAGLGHRQVAYLSGPANSAANRVRLETLRAAGTGRFDLHRVAGGAHFEDGHAAVEHLLATGATAVVGYNDLVAYGALARMAELGISVPEEVSVTGFDDIPFARYANPPLTTVAIPLDELGRQAWNRLWSHLAGEEPSPDVQFTPEVVIRHSTGPAPIRR